MSPNPLTSRHSIDSCTLQLNSWKPFSPQTLDSDPNNSNLNPKLASLYGYTKRPCLSDRKTSFSLSIVDALDMSKLSLYDDDKPLISSSVASTNNRRDRLRWMARKRRRRGASRSVSGRSSDRSRTRNGRCCSVGATATCSDFMVAAGGTDSSGELFGNGNGNISGGGGGGEVNWSSDLGDATNQRREKGESNLGAGIGDREVLGSGLGFDAQWSESGYGSEPGYRGDAEFGYGDEFDEEEEDARFFFWGGRFGDSNMEGVGENAFSEQKAHYRGRRSKKNDTKIADSVR